jgi:hypothetical protein
MPIRIVFRWVAWLLVAAVALVTLSPITLRPITQAPPDLERFAAFAAIGGAFFIGYPRHRFIAMLVAIGIALFLEATQDLVPGRHGRFHDGTAKALGVMFGAAMAMLLERSVRRSIVS